MVWHDTASAGQTWLVQYSADYTFSPAINITTAPTQLCPACTDQLQVTIPPASGRRCAFTAS